MVPIRPGLYNKQILFNEKKFGLTIGGKPIDANELLPEFESRLKDVLEDLFNPNGVFSQTENKKNCIYCSFKSLCRR
jgi:hypothetical protein